MTALILPRRIIEGEEIVVAGKTSGRVKLEKLNRYGRVIANREFKNLITNWGLDSCGTGGDSTSALSYCRVGTGTTTPVFTNTSLVNQVAATSSYAEVREDATALNQPALVTRSWTFPIGAIDTNLTEVGFGASDSGTISVRALILDDEGNPVAFPIADDEQLRVTYIRGHYGPQADIETTQNIGGTTYYLMACAT